VRTPRTLLVALLVLAVAACALVLAAGHHDVRRGEPVARPEAAVAPDSETARALAVLRGLDRRRAAAWAHDDPAGLARLYLPGSTAGRRDRAMLAEYVARGLRVRSMHRQVLAARVQLHRRERLRLEVTDRLVDAVAVGAGVRTALPAGRVQTRLITLVRVGGWWRIADVVRR
jgi:hypothetical protein